jgi:hypothetical protein
MRNSVEGRGNLQKLIGNTGWLFADRILRLGVGLVVGVWIASLSGPGTIRTLQLCSRVCRPVQYFRLAGIRRNRHPRTCRTIRLQNEILGTAFCLKLVGGGVTLAAAVAAIYLLRPGDSMVALAGGDHCRGNRVSGLRCH